MDKFKFMIEGFSKVPEEYYNLDTTELSVDLINRRYSNTISNIIGDLYFKKEHYIINEDEDLKVVVNQLVTDYIIPLILEAQKKFNSKLSTEASEVLDKYHSNCDKNIENDIINVYIKDAFPIAKELYFNRNHYDFGTIEDLKTWVFNQLNDQVA